MWHVLGCLFNVLVISNWSLQSPAPPTPGRAEEAVGEFKCVQCTAVGQVILAISKQTKGSSYCIGEEHHNVY